MKKLTTKMKVIIAAATIGTSALGALTIVACGTGRGFQHYPGGHDSGGGNSSPCSGTSWGCGGQLPSGGPRPSYAKAQLSKDDQDAMNDCGGTSPPPAGCGPLPYGPQAHADMMSTFVSTVGATPDQQGNINSLIGKMNADALDYIGNMEPGILTWLMLPSVTEDPANLDLTNRHALIDRWFTDPTLNATAHFATEAAKQIGNILTPAQRAQGAAAYDAFAASLPDSAISDYSDLPPPGSNVAN